MPDFKESGFEIIPVVDYDDGPLSFDEFIDLTVQETVSAFEQIEEPDGDVAPFLAVAAGGSFALNVWRLMDPELHEKFLSHVVSPAIVAQAVDQVALVITTYMTPTTDEAQLSHGSERYEAVVVAAVNKLAQEGVWQARIDRVDGRPPQLGPFDAVADKLPPALARPLYAGLFGELE